MYCFDDIFIKFLFTNKKEVFFFIDLVMEYIDHYKVIVLPDSQLSELNYLLWLFENYEDIFSSSSLISNQLFNYAFFAVNVENIIDSSYIYELWFKEYLFSKVSLESYMIAKEMCFFDYDYNDFVVNLEAINDNQFFTVLYNAITFNKVKEILTCISLLNWFESLNIDIYSKNDSLKNIKGYIDFYVLKHRIMFFKESFFDVTLSLFDKFQFETPFFHVSWIYENINVFSLLEMCKYNFTCKDSINYIYSYLFRLHTYNSDLNFYYYIYFRNEFSFEKQKLFMLNYDLSKYMFHFLKENYWDQHFYKRIIYILQLDPKFDMRQVYNLLYHKESFQALYYAIKISDFYPLSKIIYFYVYALITECLGPFLVIFVSILIVVAYYTLNERKIIGYMQRRKGPNVVGIFGILQPISDGVKLFFKEMIIPTKSNSNLFLIAPILVFFLALLSWLVIPFNQVGPIVDNDASILYIFALSSLNVYGIIIAGWASNSKYAFLGALRSAAQMISYEISIGLIVLSVAVCAGSLNLCDIVYHQENGYHFWLDLPGFIMFLLSALAETNRSPFDLPEAEAELVSGYNVEYSSMTFALFFLGEYANMILMSALTVILFFGGWLPVIRFEICWNNFDLCIDSSFWFAFKVSVIMFVFVWVRATVPRLRYDQLMYLGWKILLPLSLGWLIFLVSFVEIAGSPFEGELYEFSEYFISYFDI